MMYEQMGGEREGGEERTNHRLTTSLSSILNASLTLSIQSVTSVTVCSNLYDGLTEDSRTTHCYA